MNTYPIYHELNTPLRQVQGATRQEGAVLIVALMLLVVLTMMGISSMQSSTMDTKMAKNAVEYNWAFQIAERGVYLPRTYPVTTYSSIAGGFLASPPNPDQFTKQDTGTINRTLPNGTMVAAPFTVTTQRAQGTYPDTAGRFGFGGSARLAFFIIRSVGRSDNNLVGANPDPSTPMVALQGGLAQATPASKNDFYEN